MPAETNKSEAHVCKGEIDRGIEAIRTGAGEASLSTRETEVLQLIVQDLTAKEIARTLGLSSKTVEFHRYNFRRKLQVGGLTGMLPYAVKARVVDL